MREGADPTGERVQALVRRWQGLVEEFTKRDPEITRAVAQRNRTDPTAAGKVHTSAAASWCSSSRGRRRGWRPGAAAGRR